MKKDQVKRAIEGALLVSEHPISAEEMVKLFAESDQITEADVEQAVKDLSDDCARRSYELRKVSAGYRMQLHADLAPYMARLWPERSRNYSARVLEVLALIAYKQPITRASIEAARGVPVGSYTMRILNERKWIQVVGHADVPGKPSLYGTTPEFLDYFNITSLDDLPALPNSLKTIDVE